MNPSDIIAVLQWWGVLLLLGLAFLPVTILLFDKFFDKGYIFSKILGAAVTTYLIFVLGIGIGPINIGPIHLNFGPFYLVPFTTITSYLIFILTAGIAFYLIKDKWKIRIAFQKLWPVFLLEEVFFLAALMTWAYIHSFAPDIHGLEKYMDYGFINSALRGDHFPPLDMWLTPFTINYYYFGHLMTAVLTKLSGVPSNLTFNIMLSTIFAFCLMQTFSIGTALYTFVKRDERISRAKQIVAGVLTAGLVTLAGNLHVLYAFFTPYKNESPQPLWELTFNPMGFNAAASYNSYWYPNATRFIYNTIHEFPIYSWVVADLHGHVLDIPMVLFIIALLMSLFMLHDPEEKEDENAEKKNPSALMKSFIIHPFYLFIVGLFLSMMYMTNAWDGAIYLLLTSFVILFLYWQKLPMYKSSHGTPEDTMVIKNAKDSGKASFRAAKQWFIPWARDIILSIGTVTAAFSVFTIPYNLYFKPFVSGIGVLCAPEFLTKINDGRIGPFLFEANHCQHSYWWELLTLYGFFYFFVVLFIIYVTKAKKLHHSDMFVLLLITLSTLLILLPEIIYVKDIYPAHYRANTMFKLVFQAFIMLSICCGYIIFRLMKPAISVNGWIKPFSAVLFPLLTFVLLSLVFTYPYLAIGSYYNNLKTYKGLDGTAYLKTLYPADYEAIQWLNRNVKGQPVILEAQGDSYTDFARVSANTGLPTVLGWTVHEWLWRGNYDIPAYPPNTPQEKIDELKMYYPAPRINEVKALYESSDETQTKQLLKKYKVKYVFVGALEFQKYPGLNENKFVKIGKVVFQKDNTKVYELNEIK